MWGVITPQEAQQKIQEQVKQANISEPRNLEEMAISMVGTDIYEKLIKGYTEKQWGCSAKDLPAFIIKRLPLRFTYDNNYFNDKYQGIPEGGYNKIIAGLLQGVEVRLGVDFFADRNELEQLADEIVFTGKIDEFFGFSEGMLAYRSLRFEHEHLQMENFQGNAVVNYTERDIPYTRIIEHKHFEFGTQASTVITREYPDDFAVGKEPYYPINDRVNNSLFAKYEDMARNTPHVIFGGRLAEYKYYDMHQIIGSALAKAKRFLS
jgi:UDP-galactopyranose mutase